jgi:Tol biopolymer transport system component
MTLDPGTRLGPYEILSKLGSGGMGDVYLSRDTRLAREVAIKVLPAHLADTPEARARFEREARAISSLNHPHICALYDVGQENGVSFLVLEKIDGETLAARLARGALPLEQVVRLGMQIADALDRAHRSGLVHRDLKPGNVMITKSGAKLMDFGLARPFGVAGFAGESQAPTLSPSEVEPVTARGTIVGTLRYMSPEQLEGKEADARSDLWALGCVLYEMATGKPAFEGKSQASLISAIMSSEPPRISQLAPLTPASLDRLVRACLAKDPDERIQSAHDVKLQLSWIAEGEDQSLLGGSRRGWRKKAVWAGVAVGLAAIGVLGTLALNRPSGDHDPVCFLVGIPAGQVGMGAPCMSPDGRVLAFVASDSSGESRLWLRPMDSLAAHPIPGTEKAGPAIWSPDHKSLAFVSNGKLQRVPAAGGAPVTLADVGDMRQGGSWGSSGMILMEGGGRGDSMIVVPEAGGAARQASRLDRTRGDFIHTSPRFLPDGQRFLYVTWRQANDQITQAIMLGRLGSFEAREIGPCTADIDVVPPNHVLYVNGTSLVTQTLDVARGALTGDPISLAEGLPQSPFIFTAGGGSLAVTNVSGTVSELWWMDRAGHPLSRVGEPNRYREIALSPDARRAAVAIEDPTTGMDDVWVRDLDRGISTRLTFDRTQETGPVWSRDGSRIFYSSDRQGGNYLIYSISTSGVGPEDTLSVGNSGNEGPMSISPDGKWLMTISSKGATWDWDILIRDVEGKQPPRRFCASPSLEFAPTISPDGRWLAYSSDETGRSEIYVRSFPDGLRKWRVSNDGGFASAWSKNGHEIIYQNPVNDLIAVPVTPGADFVPGKPVKLFHADVTEYGWSVRRWAVTADGQRFLVNQKFKNPLRGITVTRNWESAIARRKVAS